MTSPRRAIVYMTHLTAKSLTQLCLCYSKGLLENLDSIGRWLTHDIFSLAILRLSTNSISRCLRFESRRELEKNQNCGKMEFRLPRKNTIFFRPLRIFRLLYKFFFNHVKCEIFFHQNQQWLYVFLILFR